MTDQELAYLIRAKIRELNEQLQKAAAQGISIEVQVHSAEVYTFAMNTQVEQVELSIRMRKNI